MAYVVLSDRFSAWEWVPWAVGLIIIIVIAVAMHSAVPWPPREERLAGSAVAAYWEAEDGWRRTGGTCWSWCRG